MKFQMGMMNQMTKPEVTAEVVKVISPIIGDRLPIEDIEKIANEAFRVIELHNLQAAKELAGELVNRLAETLPTKD